MTQGFFILTEFLYDGGPVVYISLHYDVNMIHILPNSNGVFIYDYLLRKLIIKYNTNFRNNNRQMNYE